MNQRSHLCIHDSVLIRHPSWEKAHPYRFIVHNGEINTIRGNADKMLAREENMESEYLKNEMHKADPSRKSKWIRLCETG